jgi:hypothetical protein
VPVNAGEAENTLLPVPVVEVVPTPPDAVAKGEVKLDKETPEILPPVIATLLAF